jgi:hypothetical protein
VISGARAIASTSAARRGTRVAAWLAPLWCVTAALAQSEPPAQTQPEPQTAPDDFIMRTDPVPAFLEPPKRKYNLKWGPVNGRFFGSVQTEFSDNINLSDRAPQSDLFFNPNFGIGLQWPISERNILELSLGMGYRAYIDHPELNSIQITPDSRLKYQMRIGKVDVLVHDKFQLQVDPLSRADINGTTGLLNFKRIVNDLGLQGEWPVRRNLSVVTSYDYVVDRSLNSDFTALDRDDHSLGLAAFSRLGPNWTAGISSSVTFSEYLRRIQNDGVSYSIGPQVTFKPSHFITIDATVAYTISQFDQTGTIRDNSDFNGISFAVSARHNINSRMTETLRGARSATPGFGSNFNDLTVLQYGLSWRLNSFLNLNTTFAYEHLVASGASGETADRFLYYAGTGWEVARRWTLGLGYSFAMKDSNQPLRDYKQNRVTVDLTHDF